MKVSALAVVAYLNTLITAHRPLETIRNRPGLSKYLARSVLEIKGILPFGLRYRIIQEKAFLSFGGRVRFRF